jgi:mono/diheme cytochrome c family protein
MTGSCNNKLYGSLYRFAVICAATLTLAACGGGGNGPDSLGPTPQANPTITGLAATGGALANATVTAKCTSGPPVSGNTGVDGTFSLELAGGQIVPCMLQAKSGTVILHGFAAVAGHVNITPLTDLAINRALGSDAASAFAGFDASKGAAIRIGLVAAKTYVLAQVTPLTGATPSVDLLTGVFKIGDADDKLLDSLTAALVAAGKTLDDLRNASVSGGSLVAVVTRQTWFFPDGAALTASQPASFDALGLYFNVHSAANPGGEMRGQIAPSSATFITDKGDPVTNNNFSALMSGAQEVPVNASTATAYSTVVLDPVAKTISAVLVTNGIAGTAAHIHNGLPTVSGPVIFPLAGGPTVWTLAATPITDAQIADLRAGAYYVNVHTTALPGGEIRGPLTQQLRFAALSGANEVPAVTTTASGTGVLALNPTTNQVSGFVKTSGITGIAAHVHEGAAGVNGGVIVPMAETSAGSGLWVVPAGSVLSAGQVVSFNAGNLYFNVHSAANGGGEIRSQIVPATIKIGNATLSGANEVPAVTTAASGTGIMALNSVTQLVAGNVQTTGIVGTVAHVHEATAGVAGPVRVPLTLTPPLSTFKSPLAVSTTSLEDGLIGSAYSQTLAATGGTAPYTWTVSVGIPPAGLNLSAAGVISGTPTAAGVSAFTVSVTDSASPAATVSKALSLNITAAPAATVLFSTQIQPIFNANCVVCHSPGGVAGGSFMNLTAGNAFASLVQSVPPRVVARSSGTSALYQRITGALLPQMPLGGVPLDAGEQTLIRNWIDQGAANN